MCCAGRDAPEKLVPDPELEAEALCWPEYVSISVFMYLCKS
jgi:hypothetical protein